jgi:hypothetical protein
MPRVVDRQKFSQPEGRGISGKILRNRETFAGERVVTD